MNPPVGIVAGSGIGNCPAPVAMGKARALDLGWALAG